MASEAFNRAVAFTLRPAIEGGLTNDPTDPGGLTKYGISQRSYPDIDIANLTIEDARKIYWRDFWLAPGLDKLPAPVAMATFDAGVNSGPGQATRFLQRACNDLGSRIKVDGDLGPITRAAAIAHSGTPAMSHILAGRALWHRLEFYGWLAKKAHHRNKFLGWTRRVVALSHEITGLLMEISK